MQEEIIFLYNRICFNFNSCTSRIWIQKIHLIFRLCIGSFTL